MFLQGIGPEKDHCKFGVICQRPLFNGGKYHGFHWGYFTLIVELFHPYGITGDFGPTLYPHLSIPPPPKKKNTLLRVIPTMTFQNSHVRFYVSLIGSGEGRHTTHLLKCVLLLSTSQTDWKQSSDIISDISFDILSDISSDILSDISFDILSDIFSGILSDISFDILSDISSDILSDILSDISFDILSDISSDILSDISFDISF